VKSKGQGTFYIGSQGNRQYYDFHTDTYKPVPVPKGAISLTAAKSSSKVIRDNESASLIDLGDGVACLEFHTKMNSIDGGIIEMLRYVAEEGQKQFRAVVLNNDAADFSAGVNLMVVIMGGKAGVWENNEAEI